MWCGVVGPAPMVAVSYQQRAPKKPKKKKKSFTKARAINGNPINELIFYQFCLTRCYVM